MILAATILAIMPVSVGQTALEPILQAIQNVETGGTSHGGRDSTGDQGRSIGPFQIQRAYWIDSGVPGRYEDCRDAEYARTVVIAYWKRWCPDALAELDFQTLARIHNGGPNGMRKSSTLAYWRKVSAELQRPAVVSTTVSPTRSPLPVH